MTIAASKLLRTEYEMPAVGEPATSRQVDVEDGGEADYTISEGARSAYWKDGSGDLRAVPRILGLSALLEWVRHNLCRGVTIL